MRHEALLSRSAGRFVRQLLDLSGPGWTIVRAGERPWASATFDGLRLRITMRSGGGSGHHIADLCARIEQADYGVIRYLVAEIAARTERDAIVVEALLIAEA
ncbi:hypothetical protein [Novosphingopyxis iocasae]|uniref:hypothetical protein n=1 Tax=Novosphingopyxis iocasae TaxID=2762729 RepID=UPI000C3FD37C|nr:hypothetical protein [Novosphingopyxis iocasae]MAC12226.1 hypothetical protein [Sphingorhabdus sp.]